MRFPPPAESRLLSMPVSERPPSPIDRAFLTNDPAAGSLILVRHGQQRWPDPATSVTADWVDPPLSDLGERQAAAVGTHLSGESIDAVYSSHLLRAHHTGLAVAHHHRLEVTVLPELEEIHLFRDLPQDQRATDTLGEEAMDQIRERFVTTRQWSAYPHTETSDEFRKRVTVAIDEILASHPGQRVVVACHAGVINAYLANLLRIEADFFYRPAHASVHRLSFKDELRVPVALNEQHHLIGDLLTV